MIRLLIRTPHTSRLGANHPEIGVVGEKKEPGSYDDLIARPVGDFLRLEKGSDQRDGTLFVGKSYYNHAFLSEIKGSKISRTLDCGCSPDMEGQNPFYHDHDITGAEDWSPIFSDFKRWRRPPIPLPNAVRPLWEVGDSAGADAVAYWAVRLVGSDIAYVQESGYKGRRGWKIRILRSDGTVTKVSHDELRGQLQPEPPL